MPYVEEETDSGESESNNNNSHFNNNLAAWDILQRECQWNSNQQQSKNIINLFSIKEGRRKRNRMRKRKEREKEREREKDTA